MDDATKFVDSSKAQWASLVRFALRTPAMNSRLAAARLGSAAGVGKSHLQRKIEAIYLASNSGVTMKELIDRGQAWTMAKFVKDKKNGRTDPEVILKWMVAPDIRDDVQKLFNRVGQVLNLRTPNDRWNFFLGCFADVTDMELLHQAGEGNAHNKRKT